MIKTGKYKTQASTVVHEGKVYKGTMPNLNMKTDLTDSFEYLATIVEGMSSGNQNGNPVYDDFKKAIIENTISGEVGKLINERGHVPNNYESTPYGGRTSSQVGIARGPGQIDVSKVPIKIPAKKDPRPAQNFPKEVGRATDLVVKKMTELQKEQERLDEAIPIDITKRGGGLSNSNAPTMLELMELFDEWEKDHPFAKIPNESATARLKRIEKRLKDIAAKASAEVEKQKTTQKKTKKKVAKPKTKKAVVKKKVVKKKVAKKKKTKKKSSKKELIIAR